jgi:hypothetical protein
MPTLRIGDFFKAGLNSDINPVELGKDYQTNLKNVRMKEGGIIPFGGYQKIIDTPAGFTPQSMFFSKTPNGDIFVIPGETKVYSYSVGFTDVSPAAMPPITNGDNWSAATISGIPIICHPVLGPLYMDGSSTVFKSLPWKAAQTWDDANQSCYMMVCHKQFLFALGVIDDGSDKFDGVRWSTPADVGAVPLNWDPLDTTSSAGITSLGGNGGRIVGGLSLRDSLVVYRENGINVFDYVGGIYVWRVRQLQTTTGLVARNALVDINGTHYFMSDSDIHTNDGNTVKSIASDRVRSLLATINTSTFQKAFAIHQSDTKEVWFCIPSASSIYNNMALVYNYQYDSWVIRDIPKALIAQVGSQTSEDAIWDNAHDTWDSATKNWDDSSSTPYNTVILGLLATDVGYSLGILDNEIGFNSEPFTSIIERTDILFNDVSDVSSITRVYVNATGSSDLKIQIGSQQYPGGPVYWKPAVKFTPNKQRKIDIRSTGCLHAYRVMADNIDSNFILTSLLFEFTMAGKR